MKYTAEQTKELATLFPTTSVDELAIIFDVPRRSIIAKLSAMGLYTRKAYVNKQGNPPVKKEALISEIADLVGRPVETLESLEKVTKSTLLVLLAALKDE